MGEKVRKNIYVAFSKFYYVNYNGNLFYFYILQFFLWLEHLSDKLYL